LIAAECVNEAFKYLSFCAPRLNNYFMYIGHSAASGVNTGTYEYQRNPKCDVCRPPLTLTVKPEDTVGEIVSRVQKQYGISELKSLSADEKFLYLKNKHEDYADNLTVSPVILGVSDGATFYITDAKGRAEKVIIRWSARDKDKDGAMQEEEDTEMSKED